MDKDTSKTFIWRSFMNSFHYLYQDAEYLRQLADRKEIAESFDRVRLSRTALLLYILSLEGLINRTMDHFLPEKVHDFFLEREDKFALQDKWLLLPLLVSQDQSLQFDRSGYPWSHFTELVGLRNDFVHPKHDRAVYYRVITLHKLDCLTWKEIPPDLGVKETDVVYRNTQIPKEPYCILPEHVDKAKKVVDDTIAELDRFLGGRIFQNNWHTSDQMTLVYPPDAKLSDLPSEAQIEQKKSDEEKGNKQL